MTPNPKDDLTEKTILGMKMVDFALSNPEVYNYIRQQTAQEILRRLSFRQQKINALWISTKLKEYEYAKMVLQEEIEYIKKELLK